MTGWPEIDFGHTGHAAAFLRRDVYAVVGETQRASKRPLRVALAGAGGIAQAKWIPAIRRLQVEGEPVSVCGVFDTDSEKAAKAANLAGAPCLRTLASLLNTAPDLLLVLTADAAHVAVARAAVEQGVPALVEKPLSHDVAEAFALVRCAHERGVLLASVANKRFSPPYALAKALIEQQALKGPLSLFLGKFTLGYPYVDLLEGGTVHLIDLALWTMGKIARLHARARTDDDVRPISVVASVGFASGAIGTLATSSEAMSFKPWERVEIFGRNAFLVVDDQLETTLFDEEVGPAKSWKPAIPNTLLFDESFGGYSPLLLNVLDAVRGLAPLGAPAADGAAAIGVIEAIRRSLSRNCEIDLAAEGLIDED